MKDQISLLHVIGGFLTSAALGFLIPSTDISPNPFGPAPFWIVILTLSVLLIGLVLVADGMGQHIARKTP